MDTVEIYKLIIITLLAAGLTTYATSHATAQRHENVSYATAKQHPDDYKGATVMWGGQIERVTGETELVVSEIPLYGLGKAPIYGAKSLGTFMVQSPAPLDSSFFQPGEVITLIGHIVGQTSGVPRVQMENVRLWQVQREPDLSESPAYNDGYPFETRDEPIQGWVYHYVPKNKMSQPPAFAQHP